MRVRPRCLASPSRRSHATQAEALITAAVLATLAASVSAQRQLDELTKPRLPADSDSSQAVALGDVDGDFGMVFGHSDSPSTGQQNRLYLTEVGAEIAQTPVREPRQRTRVARAPSP